MARTSSGRSILLDHYGAGVGTMAFLSALLAGRRAPGRRYCAGEDRREFSVDVLALGDQRLHADNDIVQFHVNLLLSGFVIFSVGVQQEWPPHFLPGRYPRLKEI